MVPMALTSLQLRGLIGCRTRYQGRSLVVVDVLMEQPAVVLQEGDGDRPIQANQFGEVGRRAPASWTIPVYEAGGALHPVFRALDLV